MCCRRLKFEQLIIGCEQPHPSNDNSCWWVRFLAAPIRTVPSFRPSSCPGNIIIMEAGGLLFTVSYLFLIDLVFVVVSDKTVVVFNYSFFFF